jgi:nicotinate-nucleotide adenylyltransferase
VRRIGIFSGSFDPIHKGHLRIIRDVLDKNLVDEVLIVPSCTAPYRKPIAEVSHLRAMAQLAIVGLTQVSIAPEGLLKASPDTVVTIRAIMRHYSGAQFYYIIGADKLAGILLWREVGRIFELCELLVYPRVGHNAQELTLFAIAHGVRAQVLSVPPVNMSSSLVRTQISLLSDAWEMIPPRVARYIALNGLYSPPYEKQVKPYMNQRRFEHTLAVRDLAVELAYHHHIPMQKAAIAALLHDCAKCMKLGQLQAIAKRFHLAQDDPQAMKSNALLHSKVGAVLAEYKYHVHDEDVLNAIRFHTTGRTKMSPLELCLFVADAAEANRGDYPGLSLIRLAMWEDLRSAALISMSGTQDHVLASGQVYSQATRLAIEDLTESLNLT